MPRLVAAVLLTAYSLVVARLTLADPSAGSWAFSFASDVADRASDGRLVWSQTEVLANIALFVPAGFLLALVVRSPWLSAVLCVLASAAIELAQQRYLPSRVPTIADVEHNGLGGLLGALLAWPVARLQNRTLARTA